MLPIPCSLLFVPLSLMIIPAPGCALHGAAATGAKAHSRHSGSRLSQEADGQTAARARPGSRALPRALACRGQTNAAVCAQVQG